MGGAAGTAAGADPVNVLQIDPKEPKRVYAGAAAGLFRSDDAGETWALAAQGLPNGPVEALALDPRQPQRLYVGVGSGTGTAAAGGLFSSDDGADTWRALPAGRLPSAASGAGGAGAGAKR